MPYHEDFAGMTPTWCPGCGDWAILSSIKRSLAKKGLSPSDIFISFDIGCSGNMNDFLNGYASHGLHGRSLPVAVGAKLANHDMPVFNIGGDGATYGEGGNHFIHACRGNHDINVIVHDNNVYGLTTGQVAPTAEQGYVSKSTPKGIIELPVNPLALAISQGATFVAQTFSGNYTHLQQMMEQALDHKGMSVINILQPCVTFNKVDTYSYYLERTYLLEDHDPSDYNEAMKRAREILFEKFPLGVLYKVQRPAFHEQVPELETPLIKKDRFTSYNELLNQFA